MKRHHVYCPEPVTTLEARWVPSHSAAIAAFAARLHPTALVHTRAVQLAPLRLMAVRLPRGVLEALLRSPAAAHAAMPVHISAIAPAVGTGTTGVLTPPHFLNCIDLNPDMLDPNDVCAPG